MSSLSNRIRHFARRPGPSLSRLLGHAYFRVTAGRRVAAGSFAGMLYALDWPHLPCLVGSYELELADVIEQIIRSAPARFIDIGAADGYYAIGMARRLPQVRVDAFEATETKQRQIARLADLNGVADRVEIKGFCDKTALSQTLQEAGGSENAVLLVDIEGGEADLLNPRSVPQLGRRPMLVEIHGRTDLVLRERFAPTHDITAIESRPRGFDDLPRPGGRHGRLAGTAVGRRFAVAAMDERRCGGQSWLWMVPKA